MQREQLAADPRQIKAIVFDLDGVILESGDIKTQAFLELFSAYPEHRGAILKHHLENLGVSRYDKFAWVYRELLHQPFTDADRERLGRRFSEMVVEKVLACPFVPGARESLEALYGKKLLFVASGTPQGELDVILTRRRIAPFFEGAWGTPLKKYQIIERVLEQYDLRRAEVLLIGDGSSDYDAAVRTGILFVARDTLEQEMNWSALGIPAIESLEGFELLVQELVV